MVRDGIFYATGFTLAAAVTAYLTNPWAAAPFFLAALLVAWFFRDPERLIPAGPVAVSPADGLVAAVVQDGPGVTRVAISLGIFDVRVNRAPISGIITAVEKCRFPMSRLDTSAGQYEQNKITIHGEDTRVVVKQIAGASARRIVFTKKPGDYVSAGERVGMVKFGSRVDVVFGPEWHLEVKEGMRVMAGTSVLARRLGVPDPIAVRRAPIEEPVLCVT